VKQADLPAVDRVLKRAYAKRHAPVIDLVKARTRDPFKILVSTILSARTRDEMTAAVSRRLFCTVRRPADLERMSRRALEKLIFPIGFYRTKARHLQALPGVLRREFGGVLPRTVEELCRLPGVGRKTANLVVAVAFDKPAICVDVHVHRISNRLGLVRTKTPLETEMALRRVLPVRYWKAWNRQIVSYGQTVCTPRSPRCDACAIRRHCRRVGVASPRPRGAKR
jgi:endonuclease III